MRRLSLIPGLRAANPTIAAVTSSDADHVIVSRRCTPVLPGEVWRLFRAPTGPDRGAGRCAGYINLRTTNSRCPAHQRPGCYEEDRPPVGSSRASIASTIRLEG
jgi:hypothetical protein